MQETTNERVNGIDIDLQGLLLSYLRKWWVIVICLVIGAAAAQQHSHDQGQCQNTAKQAGPRNLSVIHVFFPLYNHFLMNHRFVSTI